ncbi:hypothetical protein BDF21DRAFT_370258, partial [Thamnidium elegans]
MTILFPFMLTGHIYSTGTQEKDTLSSTTKSSSGVLYSSHISTVMNTCCTGIYIYYFFLSDQSINILYRGDIASEPCKKTKLRFKADIRIVVMSDDEDIVDGATAEVEKKVTPKKLLMVKLKSVLGTKCHINYFLGTIPLIPFFYGQNYQFWLYFHCIISFHLFLLTK